MRLFKKIRTLKVYEQLTITHGNRINYKSIPSIILKGEWLRELGFESGDQIQVHCENGKLVITKAAANVSEADPKKESAA